MMQTDIKNTFLLNMLSNNFPVGWGGKAGSGVISNFWIKPKYMFVCFKKYISRQTDLSTVISTDIIMSKIDILKNMGICSN